MPTAEAWEIVVKIIQPKQQQYNWIYNAFKTDELLCEYLIIKVDGQYKQSVYEICIVKIEILILACVVLFGNLLHKELDQTTENILFKILIKLSGES